MKTPSLFRYSPRVLMPANILRGAWLLLALLFGAVASAHAQTPQPNVWTIYYGNECYNFTSQGTGESGNALLQYATYDGGSAVLTWDPTANAFVSVVFTPPTGGTATYALAGSGQPPGTLIVTDNGTNALQSIGSATYSSNGNLALTGPADATLFHSFVYNAETYSLSQTWTDILGNQNFYYQNASGGTAQKQSPLFPGFGPMVGTLQISPASGGGATYTNSLGETYSSTSLTYVLTGGTDALTSIENIPVNGGVIASPFPNFLYASGGYALQFIQWDDPTRGTSYLYYGNGAAWVTYDGTNSSSVNFDISSYDYATGAYDEDLYTNGSSYGRPGTFFYAGSATGNQGAGNLLRGVNSMQYVAEGSFAVPAPAQPPSAAVTSFQYNGEQYVVSGGGTWANGYAYYQYVGANGSSATLRWDASTKQVSSLEINSTSGGDAYYTYNASSATYTLQDGSSSPNALNWVNNVAYTLNGNMATAPANSSDQGNLFCKRNAEHLYRKRYAKHLLTRRCRLTGLYISIVAMDLRRL